MSMMPEDGLLYLMKSWFHRRDTFLRWATSLLGITGPLKTLLPATGVRVPNTFACTISPHSEPYSCSRRVGFEQHQPDHVSVP